MQLAPFSKRIHKLKLNNEKKEKWKREIVFCPKTIKFYNATCPLLKENTQTKTKKGKTEKEKSCFALKL